MKLSILAVIPIVILTACSAKAPSDSDAKESVVSDLGGCARISLGSFEKTNGVADGENQYKVALKYSLNILPDNDNAAEYTAKVNDLTQKIAQAEQKLKEVDSAHRVWYDDVSQKNVLNAQWAKNLDFIKQKDDIKKELEPLKQSLLNLKSEPVNRFTQACSNTNAGILKIIADTAKEYETANPDKNAYKTGFTAELTGIIPMIKTDKGWKQSL